MESRTSTLRRWDLEDVAEVIRELRFLARQYHKLRPDWELLTVWLVRGWQGRKAPRLCDFIELCEEWHHRLKRGAMPDARELERFGDLIESGSWRIPCPDGTELRMRGGPVFSERQVSWNHPEPLPSRERAAWEAWRHLTGGNT